MLLGVTIIWVVAFDARSSLRSGLRALIWTSKHQLELV